MLNSYYTLPQILSVIGLLQTVYALVYIGSRVVRTGLVFIPILFYATLVFCFLYNFAITLPMQQYNAITAWAAGIWMFIPALSYLLIVQLTHLRQIPEWRHFTVLTLPALAIVVSLMMGDDQTDWLNALAVCVGSVILLLLWLQREQRSRIRADRAFARSRYWLIICLIAMTTILIGTHSMELFHAVTWQEGATLRSVLGLMFVYLSATSLFRLYPLALPIAKSSVTIDPGAVSATDKDILRRLANLLDIEKVYQDPVASRSTLAAELGVSEAIVSRLANENLGKTIPQILNEHRVEDAKALLRQTDAPIQVISSESGFSSLATFNRVFRDISGQTPSGYRRAQHSK
ncbi:MAG: AraC family transcriptional regulator [Pseudomonadota bacterium]